MCDCAGEDNRALEEAAGRIRSGEVVAFATETFFGLAVDPRIHEAVRALLELKSRPPGEGLPLIIDSPRRADEWVLEEESVVRRERLRLQEHFWPGPLTIVFSASELVRGRFGAGVFCPEGSLAVRCSSDPLASRIALAVGEAITATSANPRGAPPPRTKADVKAYYPDIYAVGPEEVSDGEGRGLSGAFLAGGKVLPSTIIDVRRLPFAVLRKGAVDMEELVSWTGTASCGRGV